MTLLRLKGFCHVGGADLLLHVAWEQLQVEEVVVEIVDVVPLEAERVLGNGDDVALRGPEVAMHDVAYPSTTQVARPLNQGAHYAVASWRCRRTPDPSCMSS